MSSATKTNKKPTEQLFSFFTKVATNIAKKYHVL